MSLSTSIGGTPPNGGISIAPNTVLGQDDQGNLVSRSLEEFLDFIGIADQISSSEMAAERAESALAQVQSLLPSAAFNFSPNIISGFNFTTS